MILYPAIDMYEGRAVRLTKGDYARMTVYSDDIAAQARTFRDAGATHLHMVDLEGAKTGETPNIAHVERAIRESGLFVEIGGGIRSAEAAQKYLDAGAGRIILGTAALTNEEFLKEMLLKFGASVAVGLDIKDGMAATHGWTKVTGETCAEAFARLEKLGVKTVILTDISRDGMLSGANTNLYRDLSRNTDIDIIASGGVASLDDLTALRDMGLSGAILGKAYYEGRVSVEDALAACTGEGDAK